MKLYNSNKIMKAIRGSKPKHEVIKKLSKEILNVRKDKKMQEEFAIKAYEVVLKNLSSTKKEVIKDNEEKSLYSVNKSGISKNSYRYSHNAENIGGMGGNFFKCLVEIQKELPSFLKVLSPQKRILLKKFVQNANLITENKPNSLPLNIDIEWENITNKKMIKELKLKYESSDIALIFGEDWYGDKLQLIRLDFQGYAVVEQLYNQIKKLLELELKQNVKELINFKKFLADIDTKFGNYIKSVETLNELRKGD